MAADFNKVEKVKLLKAVRVREAGKDFAKDCKAGDVVSVGGQDKIELLSRGLGTTDIKSGGK